MFNRLVSLGSAVLDVSMLIPALPPRGGDAFSEHGFSMIGGGHNVNSAAARLGLKVVHAGSTGVGPSADLLALELRKEGIEFAGEVFAKSDLGICVALIEPDGERTFITQAGAESKLTIKHLRGLKLGPTDALYISGYELYHPGSRAALNEWLLSNPLNGAALFFDPTSMIDHVDPEVVQWLRREAFVITSNETEFEKLQPRETDRALFVRRIGAKGCELYESSKLRQKVPGISVEVKDTTGAGDVHTGALIAMLAGGQGWPEALMNANKAAAYCVTRFGGATGPDIASL